MFDDVLPTAVTGLLLPERLVSESDGGYVLCPRWHATRAGHVMYDERLLVAADRSVLLHGRKLRRHFSQ